jgi:hypothetical protein
MAYLRASARLCALPAMAALVLATWPTLPLYAADQYNQSVIGMWKLTKVLDSSEISSIDDDDAEKLIGKVLTIAKDRVQLGDRVCSPPSFEATREDPQKHMDEQAHASADKMGLPNPVTVVQLSCTVAFIKNPDRLVVHWKGYFFDAVREHTQRKL